MTRNYNEYSGLESKRQATFPSERLSNQGIKIYSIEVNESKQKM